MRSCCAPREFIQALEPRVLLTAFTDNFDRPDSSSVGNGWSDASAGSGSNLGIKNNQLSGTSPSGGTGGIYRPFDLSAPVTVSATLYEESGFYSDYLRRYSECFTFASDGQVYHGYGIYFGRGDDHYNDSSVTLMDNRAIVKTLASSFQYGSSLNIEFTIRPDGSIDGNVAEGTNSFSFSFDAYEFTSSGSNFGISVDQSTSGTQPRIDNLQLSSQDAPAPKGLQASDGTYADEVHLDWDAVPGATYEIWRNTTNDSTGASKIADGVNGTTYNDTSVELNVTYYYWANAVTTGGTSPFSVSDRGYAPKLSILVDDSGGHGFVTGSRSSEILHYKPLTAKLVIDNNLPSIWFHVVTAFNSASTDHLQADDAFSKDGWLPPGGTASYRAIFTQAGEVDRVYFAFDTKALGINVTDLILQAVGAPATLGDIAGFYQDIAGLSSFKKVLTDLASPTMASARVVGDLKIFVQDKTLQSLLKSTFNISAKTAGRVLNGLWVLGLASTVAQELVLLGKTLGDPLLVTVTSATEPGPYVSSAAPINAMPNYPRVSVSPAFFVEDLRDQAPSSVLA